LNYIKNRVLTRKHELETIVIYVNKIVIFVSKMPRLLFFLYFLPVFLLFFSNIFSSQLFISIGVQVPNEIFAGILMGVMIFACLSLFSIELRVLDIPKFSQLKIKKFIVTIFVIPTIIGVVSDFFDITLDWNSFIYLIDILSFDILITSIDLNDAFYMYFLMLLKLLPTALATVYFIKLFIFIFISNMCSLIINLIMYVY